MDRDHLWHMTTLAELCRGRPGVLMATPLAWSRLADAAAVADACRGGRTPTAAGAEGMVVKPLDWSLTAARGWCNQRSRSAAASTCGSSTARNTRGRSTWTACAGGLGLKRSLAVREFALGVEALERFVRREPLRRVHECVFGVLALESEPVDPRL